MLEIIGLVIASAVIVIFAIAATKPAAFRVERSVVIAAKPIEIMPLGSDFHNWECGLTNLKSVAERRLCAP